MLFRKGVQHDWFEIEKIILKKKIAVRLFIPIVLSKKIIFLTKNSKYSEDMLFLGCTFVREMCVCQGDVKNAVYKSDIFCAIKKQKHT